MVPDRLQWQIDNNFSNAGIAVAVVGGIAAAGTIGAVGNVVAGQTAAKGAEKAASTEAAAQTQAVNTETQQGNAAAALQQPYEQYGTSAGNMLLADLQPGGSLAQVPSLTSADITQMPGYEFTLQQGLLSTQNAQAAQGLGVSGNALAAAGQYATGLAATNYQNYFSDFWANQNNRYNMLYNLTTLGENAATNAGNNMVTVGGQIGNTLTTSAANIGSAQAAAGAATASGIASGANSLSSGVSNALLANALLGQTQGGSTIPNLTTGVPQSTAGTSAMYGIPMENLNA